MTKDEVRSELYLMINDFGDKNETAKSLNKVLDAKKAEIKKLMGDYDIDTLKTDTYKATYSVIENDSLNEDKLLSCLLTVPAWVKLATDNNLVKTVHQVDFDALENAIYNGKIPKDKLLELDTMKESRPVVKLLVSKLKKKKKQEDE